MGSLQLCQKKFHFAPEVYVVQTVGGENTHWLRRIGPVSKLRRVGRIIRRSGGTDNWRVSLRDRCTSSPVPGVRSSRSLFSGGRTKGLIRL